MALVQLVINDPAMSLTLRVMLQEDGHTVVSDTPRDQAPHVIIVDDAPRAVTFAQTSPTLILAGPSDIPAAVAAMREGVYGYIFKPLQPGEAGIMVRRAARRSPAQGTAPPGSPSMQESPPVTLEEAEARHILAVLRFCKGNRTRTARLLGIGRNTLWRKLRSIGQSSTGNQP